MYIYICMTTGTPMIYLLLFLQTFPNIFTIVENFKHFKYSKADKGHWLLCSTFVQLIFKAPEDWKAKAVTLGSVHVNNSYLMLRSLFCRNFCRWLTNLKLP